MELRKLTWNDFPNERERNFIKETFKELPGNVIDVLKYKKAPPFVRVYVATRNGIVSKKVLQLFVCDCAIHIESFYTNFAIRKAIDVSELFSKGFATEYEHKQACNNIDDDLPRKALLNFNPNAVIGFGAREAARCFDYDFSFRNKVDFDLREKIKNYLYNAELERQAKTLLYLIQDDLNSGF